MVSLPSTLSVPRVADALLDFYANHREFVMRDNIKIEKKKYAWSEMLTKIFDVSKQIER